MVKRSDESAVIASMKQSIKNTKVRNSILSRYFKHVKLFYSVCDPFWVTMCLYMLQAMCAYLLADRYLCVHVCVTVTENYFSPVSRAVAAHYLSRAHTHTQTNTDSLHWQMPNRLPKGILQEKITHFL